LDIYYVFFKIQNILAAKEALTGGHTVLEKHTFLHHKPFCTNRFAPKQTSLHHGDDF
jgi:hypothetical protein